MERKYTTTRLIHVHTYTHAYSHIPYDDYFLQVLMFDVFYGLAQKHKILYPPILVICTNRALECVDSVPLSCINHKVVLVKHILSQIAE